MGRSAALAVLAGALVLTLALPGRAAAASNWCGTDEVSADRRPDSIASWEFHVVYAVPSDGEDRFFAAASGIAYDLGAIDRWWRREDPTRTPRVDLFDFPGCTSDGGRLDLSFVRLPRSGADYLPALTRTSFLEQDLVSAGTLASGYKKYLVYYDGPTGSEDICGQATNAAPFARSYAFVYLQHDQCGSLGTAGYEAIVAAHEMIHAYGALPWPFPNPGPPHPCSDLSHPCDSGSDILWSGGYCCLFDRVLDYGRDDYYDHGGSWPDIRNSPFLRHLDAPQYPLTVNVVGADGVGVQSEPEGIDCPTTCTATWDAGSQVTLVPSAPTGYRLARWSGACTGTGNQCVVAVNAATNVTATFARLTPRNLTLAVTVRGRGRVGGGVSCSRGTCRRSFAPRATVRLRAVPAAHARFVAWKGACHGRGGCKVRMSRSTGVTAVFSR